MSFEVVQEKTRINFLRDMKTYYLNVLLLEVKNITQKSLSEFITKTEQYYTFAEKDIITMEENKADAKKIEKYVLRVGLVTVMYLIILKLKNVSTDTDYYLTTEDSKEFEELRTTREYDEEIKYREIYNSLRVEYPTSLSIRFMNEFYDHPNFEDIEKYFIWIEKQVDLDIRHHVCLLIYLERVVKNQEIEFLSWLKNNYDTLCIGMLIVACKLYGEKDCFVDDVYFSRRFHMNLPQIIEMEIALIVHIDTFITREYYISKSPSCIIYDY